MIKTYKQITFCENKKGIKLLENFNLHLKNYLDNLQLETSYGPLENEIAEGEHKEISKLIDEARSYIEATFKDKNIWLKREDIHDKNILHRSYICTSLINDSEKAIAIYKKDSKRAKQRTYNPFFWIILLIDYLVSFLFEALSRAGFKQKRIEASFVGKLIKFIFYVLSSLFLGIITYLVIYALVKAGRLPAF